MDYRQLANFLYLEKQHIELKNALTHKSFYNNNEDKSNSRFVFLGMYGFKGKVAELLFNYQPNTGTQLQHFLGNIFKEEILDRIFEKYGLSALIRFGSGFDAQKHRHIFVYGFLGFICKYTSPDKLNQFIVNHFLIGNEHLIPGFDHNKDYLAQCNYFSLLIYQTPINQQTSKTADGKFTSTIFADKQELASATSKSYRYSQKSAEKQALKKLSELLSNAYHNNPIVKQLETEREKAKAMEQQQLIEERQKIRQQKIEDKKAQRLEKQKLAANLAKTKDYERRKAKEAAKLRREKAETARQKKEAAAAKISSNKRRYLEDKNK